MSNNTANQNVKNFLDNLIYNVDAIRTQVESRVYPGGEANKPANLPQPA